MVPEIKAAAAMRVEKIMVVVEDLDLSVSFKCFGCSLGLFLAWAYVSFQRGDQMLLIEATSWVSSLRISPAIPARREPLG